ncbi:MAG TPA: transporter [Elusimicrobiales bacterium]|nr:transporter [Elusimicrobiales bacterium]
MTKQLIRFALPALLAGCAGPVFAFHPMMTEDTRFLDRDGRQVEVGFEHSASNEGTNSYSNTLTGEISYGLFKKVTLLLSAPWQGWRSNGISESGPGDVSMEAKFNTGRKHGWRLALKPGFSMPAGNEAKSLGAGNGKVWLYGIAGRTEGPWEYYLNAGFLLNRNSLGENENILKASAAAAYLVLPATRILADLAVETNADKQSSTPPVNSLFGLAWSPYPTLDIDAGAKFGLNAPARSWGLLFGFTLRL